jgi:hypothetical protein
MLRDGTPVPNGLDSGAYRKGMADCQMQRSAFCTVSGAKTQSPRPPNILIDGYEHIE